MNLKQLSHQLGLSQTTVSRALNGYPEVSERTRQRVVAAATRFNYAPSNRAKGLATGKAYAIGHVVPISSKHEMVNPIFADFITGASDTYAANGYEMLISTVAQGVDQAVAYRALMARGVVDGVVLHAPRQDDTRIPLLTEMGLPFVVHGRVSNATLPYSWVDVNNRSAFRQATELLLDLGHTRFALINGQEDMDFAIRRRAGFEEALAARGLMPHPDWMVSDEMSEQIGYQATRRMLAGPTRPTAILTASVVTAIGVRRAVEEAGLTMARDVSIATYDDRLSYLPNGGAAPVFTAVRSSVRDAGQMVAELLMTIIRDPAKGALNRQLEVELAIGTSTGPAPDQG